MSNRFRHWFLSLAVCVAAGFAVAAVAVRPAPAEEEARHQVRMSVDFTVLPVVLPDGTEAPAMPATPPQAPGAEADIPDAQEADVPDAAPATTPAPIPAETARPEPPAPVGASRPAPPPASPAPAENAEVPALAPATGAGVIRSVSLDETSLGFSVIVIADQAVGRTAVLRLDSPPRLVVDILGTWRYRGGNVLRSEGAVKHVVLGEHPDRFRMVVHFRTPPKKPLDPDVRKAGNELHVLVPMP